jgi:iron complex outermembrane recepter protein
MVIREKLGTSLVLAVGGWLVALPTLAQTPPAPPPPPPQQQLERVEITGSSIKRIDAETALPVQVITREQIQRSGVSNVEQLMEQVTALSSSQGLTTASASGATTGGISAISLRGLGSLRTLVLLNGRRIAPYGIGFLNDSVSVDVNSIPISAIERVEILKDGASAIYGSDAIAGVVNFILRQEFQGVEATAEYGDTAQGGASLKRGTVTGGFGNLASDRFNVMGTISYQKEASLVGAQRSFASTSFNSANDTTSGNTFPGNVAPVGGGHTINPSFPGCPPPYAVHDTNFDPGVGCRFDTAPLVTLVPESEHTSLFGSGKFAITPDIQAYGEASYNENKTHTIIQPVPLSDQFALPSQNVLCSQAPYNTVSPGSCVSAIILTPSSPFYPTAAAQAGYGGTPNLLVRYRDAINGNRDFTDISQAPRAVAGVKGTAAGWDFDVAALYSESKVREQINGGYPLNSQILPLLNSGTVNFFGPNAADVVAEANADTFQGDAFKINSTLTSLTAKGSKDIYQMPAGPLSVAFGGEARQEKYDFMSSPQLSSGDISGYGGDILSVNRSRSVDALFGELAIPIVKNLDADLSLRYDRYEGVGSTTNPKGSLRWQPTPQILLRTAYGKGFRAPSLGDLYTPNTTAVTVNGLSDPLRCQPPNGSAPVGNNSSTDCLTQFSVTNGGNAQLHPETSENFTLGAVIEPVKDLTATIDYYKIHVGNTIINGLDPAFILANLDQFGNLVTRGPASGGLPGHIININTTNLNLGTTKTQGLDLDLSYRYNFGEYGRFILDNTSTYIISFESENPDGSFSSAVDQSNTATGGVTPRFKNHLMINWTLGPWGATLANNYQKRYHDNAGNVDGLDRLVDAYSIWDLQGTWQALKSWQFTLGVKDLFNKAPPYAQPLGVFQSGYDPTYGDPRDRFIYGRVTYSYGK